MDVTKSVVKWKYLCLCCWQPHALSACMEFKKLSDRDRLKVILGRAICHNCLALSHRTFECQWRNKCSLCNGRHHYLLHGAYLIRISAAERLASIPNILATLNSNGDGNDNRSYVGLCNTAWVLVGVGTRRWPLRVCIVEHQDISAIQSTTLERLGLSTNGCSGHRSVNLRLESRQNPYFTAEGRFAVDEGQYGCLPAKPINGTEVKRAYLKLAWADPDFAKPAPIEAIVGGNLYHSVMLAHTQKVTGMPTARASAFGWTLDGVANALDE